MTIAKRWKWKHCTKTSSIGLWIEWENYSNYSVSRNAVSIVFLSLSSLILRCSILSGSREMSDNVHHTENGSKHGKRISKITISLKWFVCFYFAQLQSHRWVMICIQKCSTKSIESLGETNKFFANVHCAPGAPIDAFKWMKLKKTFALFALTQRASVLCH